MNIQEDAPHPPSRHCMCADCAHSFKDETFEKQDPVCNKCRHSNIAGPFNELRCCHPVMVMDWVEFHHCESVYGYTCEQEKDPESMGSQLCLSGELFEERKGQCILDFSKNAEITY